MKGITPIISIIVLLLITVSLAGAAYVFLGGYMTAYTGRAVQVSNPGTCIGGTEALITVTNMGSLSIDLGSVAGVGSITGDYTECGDIRVIRTDGGTMTASFSAASIAAAQPSELDSVTFRDTNCASGSPVVCKYAFTRAGELQAVESTVSCSG